MRGTAFRHRHPRLKAMAEPLGQAADVAEAVRARQVERVANLHGEAAEVKPSLRPSRRGPDRNRLRS